jgi:hypothetical protein
LKETPELLTGVFLFAAAASLSGVLREDPAAASDPFELGLEVWNLGVAIFVYVVVVEFALLSFLEMGLL